MKKLPPIIHSPSSIEKTANIIAIITLLAHFAVIAYYYDGLPERIPTHFGLDGKADGWSQKNSLWFMLGISGLIFGFLKLIDKIPEEFINYPVKITAANKQKQYQIMRELMALLGAGINLLFLFISWGIIQTALGAVGGLGVWFMLVVLTFVFAPIGYSLQQAYKYKD